MKRQEVLAAGVEQSGRLITRYFKGFDDSNRVKQAPSLPNHFAWTLGHLSLLINRAAGMIDGGSLPDEHFVSGDGKSGDARRYDANGLAFGSTPIPDPAIYPTAARCTEIFNAAIARLAAAFRAADDARLESVGRWVTIDVPLWTLGVRMVFHNGTHCGQLADLRRALGFRSVFE